MNIDGLSEATLEKSLPEVLSRILGIFLKSANIKMRSSGWRDLEKNHMKI